MARKPTVKSLQRKIEMLEGEKERLTHHSDFLQQELIDSSEKMVLLQNNFVKKDKVVVELLENNNALQAKLQNSQTENTVLKGSVKYANARADRLEEDKTVLEAKKEALEQLLLKALKAIAPMR